jgi:hypothetical protein
MTRLALALAALLAPAALPAQVATTPQEVHHLHSDPAA